MVKPTKHWVGDNFSFSAQRGIADRSALGDSLVRAPWVEEGGVLASKPGQVMVIEDENVVEHLTPEGPSESLRDSVHIGRPDRRLDDANAGTFRCTIEGPTELVVAIPDQELRRAAVHGGVADLLGGPVLRRVACGGYVDNAAGGQVDDEKKKHRAEEEVVALDEIAGPESWA